MGELVLTLSVCASGALLGCLGFRIVAQAWHLRTRRHVLALQLGNGEVQESFCQSAGLAAMLVSFLERESRRCASAAMPEGIAGRLFFAGSGMLESRIAQAGLSRDVSFAGALFARRKIVAAASACAFVLGAPLSWQMSMLGVCLAVVLGCMSVPWALGCEASARREKVEAELSGMMEVVSLGLSAGLSFERSIDLYCRHFPTFLAKEFRECLRQWEWGLASREEALRGLAEELDCPILTRTVESMVRSLRFGVAIAPALEEIAWEARDLRKTRLEERVARAPIKMMIPVGALILPAMLLIVLGPVLLELVEGF